MAQGHSWDKSKRKIFCEEKIIPEGRVVVAGPISPEQLENCKMDRGLKMFRQPDLQHQALVEIAGLPEGRVITAKLNDTIIAYVTFHYPDKYGRWGRAKMICLLELGAIEVAPGFRGRGLAPLLLRTAFADPEMERFIIISTEYYWEWDMEGTGLSIWQYKKMMEKLMGTVDLRSVGTDDPEISSHPANSLMTRFGKLVDLESLHNFEILRYKGKYTI